MGISDEEFQAFASEYEQEELNRNASRGSGSFTREYEEIKWTGLEPQKMKILRFLGGIPDSANADNFTAKVAQVGWVKGDDGKNFRCVLPPQEKDPDHLMWRIIKRVNEVAWINKKRVYVNEVKHAEIFNRVNFNGLGENDPKRKFDKGWQGRQVIVINTIDREQMDWHRENKHTMLLSRNIGYSQDGTREYPEEGVPVYGFFNVIVTNLFKNYGNWEYYDIGVKRLGTTQTPYQIINASAYAAAKLPEVPKELVKFVSSAALTEEELSWTRYDLKKMYSPSSYTKLYNKLRLAIQTIDAKLGTQFFKELEYEMEKEKEAREAVAQAGLSPDTQPSIVSEVQVPSKPVAPVIPSITPTIPVETSKPTRAKTVDLNEESIAALKGWEALSPEHKALITKVKIGSKGIEDVTYNSSEPQFRCPQCGIPSPESFPVCPSCGLNYN